MRIAALVCAALLAYIPITENSRADTPYSQIYTNLCAPQCVQFASDIRDLENGGFAYRYTLTNNSDKPVLVRWTLLDDLISGDFDRGQFFTLDPHEIREIIVHSKQLPLRHTSIAYLFTPRQKGQANVTILPGRYPLFSRILSGAAAGYVPRYEGYEEGEENEEDEEDKPVQ